MLVDPADISRMRSWIMAEENQARAEVTMQRFNAMAAFAEAQTCRRLVLLNYFGEANQTACGNCDICLDPPIKFDGTVLAQKALSCVYRVGQSFGMHHVIDVLRGSQNQRILELGQDKLSTFGIGADLTNAQLIGTTGDVSEFDVGANLDQSSVVQEKIVNKKGRHRSSGRNRRNRRRDQTSCQDRERLF